MACRFFFVADIFRIYKSYDTRFLRATLCSPHELIRRKPVVCGEYFSQSHFIFATTMSLKCQFENSLHVRGRFYALICLIEVLLNVIYLPTIMMTTNDNNIPDYNVRILNVNSWLVCISDAEMRDKMTGLCDELSNSARPCMFFFFCLIILYAVSRYPAAGECFQKT